MRLLTRNTQWRQDLYHRSSTTSMLHQHIKRQSPTGTSPSFHLVGNIYSNFLKVLWSSIALLSDELEALLYFFKFGTLFLSAAKQEGENFKVFEDRKLWDSLKVSPLIQLGTPVQLSSIEIFLFIFFFFSSFLFSSFLIYSQKGLTASDSMPRKQALFLLKNIVHLPRASWSKYVSSILPFGFFN